ncbi:DUF1240 domain-containing protein [Yersinia pseudotuberculosis]|uniref:DUF1240 domain-containing protein n=1 Tax=Yersinia pseudotuberculosis TaxID=633 RepID=UPI00070F0983|nr:DUF1240 domain-containing protein [Yersinia pseudotuberculosis]
MVKINRPLVGAFAVLLFFLSSWGCWFSLSGYLAFFKLSDIIIFSWKVGFVIFPAPLLFYFSYLAFYSAIKNKPATMNNKLANALAILAILGSIISLFSSAYISYSLTEYSYKSCPRSSWMSPNEYVKDIKLCP